MAQPVTRSDIGGFTAEFWPRAAYDVRGTSVRSVVGFAFETQTGVDAIGDRKADRFRRQANTLSWVPPGCPVFSRSDEGGEYLAIHGMPVTMIGHPEAGERPLNGIVDAGAVHAAHALRRALVSGSRDGAEGLHILAAVLLRRFEGGSPAPRWLTASRLATIDRYVDAHIHEPIGLVRLAAELDLSVGFLVRAFLQDVGITPHRYVMERRLARARMLLSARHPIAAVSVACGFADQAHLTRSMKRVVGITPAACRIMSGRLPTPAGRDGLTTPAERPLVPDRSPASEKR